MNIDVLIVGGGIAGCMTAGLLGKVGIKTLVVEKASQVGGLSAVLQSLLVTDLTKKDDRLVYALFRRHFARFVEDNMFLSIAVATPFGTFSVPMTKHDLEKLRVTLPSGLGPYRIEEVISTDTLEQTGLNLLLEVHPLPMLCYCTESGTIGGAQSRTFKVKWEQLCWYLINTFSKGMTSVILNSEAEFAGRWRLFGEPLDIDRVVVASSVTRDVSNYMWCNISYTDSSKESTIFEVHPGTKSVVYYGSKKVTIYKQPPQRVVWEKLNTYLVPPKHNKGKDEYIYEGYRVGAAGRGKLMTTAEVIADCIKVAAEISGVSPENLIE